MTQRFSIVAALLFSVVVSRLEVRAQPSQLRVDASTLTGKLMCGYQGWFTTEGDGANLGWRHWTKNPHKPLAPDNAKIDLWPDVSELKPEERFATGFRHANGRPAEVFSSFTEATVVRHFQWMQDYGIDGVFVQRFINAVKDPRQLQQNNIVLGHCRTGANRHGRVFAVLYDLSGLGPNRMNEVKEDWLALQKEMRITADPSYLRHRGKPLVTVWGVGFNDHRQYTLAECRELVEFLNRNGCTVMLGVPTYWRELKKDTVADPALHDLLKLADVISPWTVGRYRSPEQAKMHARTVLTKDLAWCREQKLDYLPVIFPGFSWRNMHGGELNAVPRLKGEFFWSQFAGARQAGAQMIYVAMFDEVDEGTAIFKCTNDVPDSGDTKFVTYEGLPSDFYLRLAGMAAGMLNGKLPFRVELPLRKP